MYTMHVYLVLFKMLAWTEAFRSPTSAASYRDNSFFYQFTLSCCGGFSYSRSCAFVDQTLSHHVYHQVPVLLLIPSQLSLIQRSKTTTTKTKSQNQSLLCSHLSDTYPRPRHMHPMVFNTKLTP